MRTRKEAKFSDLVGMTLTSVEGHAGGECIQFTTQDGRKFQQIHYQDCYEDVRVNDIIGDFADLLDTPLLVAEERTSMYEEPSLLERVKERFDIGDPLPDSYTWTFYELRTVKGSVTIRWYGTSNGYYGEGVDFEEVV